MSNRVREILRAFIGATASVKGHTGLVPAPAAGDESKFLKADGTWATAGGSDSRIIGPARLTGSAQTISSTSAADVAGVSLSLAANNAGRARLMLLFTGASTGTLDLLWSYPTGFTAYWADANELYGSFSFDSNQIAESGTKVVDTYGMTDAGLIFFDMRFVNGVNAGTLQLRAKRSTTGGTNPTIRVGTQIDAMIA